MGSLFTRDDSTTLTPLNEEVIAIDNQIRLAEEMKQSGDVAGANSMFKKCAILLERISSRIPIEQKNETIALLVDMQIRRCRLQPVSVIIGDLP